MEQMNVHMPPQHYNQLNMADFSALVGEIYNDVRVDETVTPLLIDKTICCFVKGKTQAEIVTILNSYEDETDFYSIECRTGSMLFIQPNLFDEVQTVIEGSGAIFQVQTG